MEEIKRKINWKTVVVIILAALLIFCLAKINELENQISNLDNTIASYNHQVSNMQNNINSIYTNVEDRKSVV